MRQLSSTLLCLVIFFQLGFSAFAAKEEAAGVEIYIDGKKFSSMDAYKEYKLQNYIDEKEIKPAEVSSGTDSNEPIDEKSYMSELDQSLKNTLKERKEPLSLKVDPSKVKTITIAPQKKTADHQLPQHSILPSSKVLSTQDFILSNFNRVMQALSEWSISAQEGEMANALSLEQNILEKIPKTSLKNIEEDDLEKMFKKFHGGGFYDLNEPHSPSEDIKYQRVESTQQVTKVEKQTVQNDKSEKVSQASVAQNRLTSEISNRSMFVPGDWPHLLSYQQNSNIPPALLKYTKGNRLTHRVSSFVDDKELTQLVARFNQKKLVAKNKQREVVRLIDKKKRPTLISKKKKVNPSNKSINENMAFGLNNPPIIIDRTQSKNPVLRISVGQLGQLKAGFEKEERKEEN